MFAPLGNSDSTYDQIAEDDLEDLGCQAGPSCKQSLKNVDQDVAEGGADEQAVRGHLWYSRGEVMAVLVAIFGDPGREQFLKSGQRSRRQHLCAQRVGLQLLEVGLMIVLG